MSDELPPWLTAEHVAAAAERLRRVDVWFRDCAERAAAVAERNQGRLANTHPAYRLVQRALQDRDDTNAAIQREFDEARARWEHARDGRYR